jgi:uncharacterized phage protein (TIGR01671 family)
MKREIKFRAWDSKYQKMYYSHGDNPRVNCFHGDWEIDLESENGDTIGTVGCDEKTYPLMQYTGLKDKNGKDIYEGDVLKVELGVGYSSKHYPSFTNGTQRKSIITVEFDVNYQKYNTNPPPDTNFDREFEVIGNIHENPELIK